MKAILYFLVSHPIGCDSDVFQKQSEPWDGTILKLTSHMPSTQFTVYHESRMVNRETMTSSTSATGGATHTVTWKKTD